MSSLQFTCAQAHNKRGHRYGSQLKKLWKLLIGKDLKKKDLSRVAGIGTSAIAKMNRGEHVSMDILLKICNAFNCDFGDIVEAVPEVKE